MKNPDREELVKLEAERAELAAKNEAATSWGAAVGARCERILEIDRRIATLRRLASSDGEPDPVAWPANLNPRTLDLVQRFALALAKKLRLAEEKYGHTDGWSRDDWEAECRDHLYQHLEKGDPRDVAAYCAFMWHHGWITYRPEITAPPADAGMRRALESIRQFGADTLSGRADGGPDDRNWQRDAVREMTRRARAALTAPGATTKSDGAASNDIDTCIACAVPLVDGDMVYSDASGGCIHAACCGPERESYVGKDGEPLKDGDPIPEPWPWTVDPSSTRSEVTVEELARELERHDTASYEWTPQQFDTWWTKDPHAVNNRKRQRSRARALLDQFEIRRK